MTKLVQLIFSDSTLGGTSRSAIQIGAAWRLAGFEVRFLPQLDVEPSRARELSEIGDVVRAGKIQLSDGIVHYHHGAWSPQQLEVASKLLDAARSVGTLPQLITHNVFGVPDHVLDAWPGTRTVGLLGNWSAAQYRMATMGRHARGHVALVPNPQDLGTFRPPTPTERTLARDRHKLSSSGRVALRLGSPHESKWSPLYVDLVRDSPGVQFIFVGCPPTLASALEHFANVRLLGQVSDDAALRDLYWAADSFVHIADRGESFGNVLLESLLCGTPVACLGRPFRDNTPWEFATLDGFEYFGRFAHLAAATRRLLIAAPQPTSDRTRTAIAGRYSTTGVAEQLNALSRGQVADGFELKSIGMQNLAKVAIRHNRLAARLKEIRATKSAATSMTSVSR